MSDSTQINLRVMVKTVERLENLCKVLFRGKGYMIDYLVNKEWAEVKEKYRVTDDGMRALEGGDKTLGDPIEGYLADIGEPAEKKAAG